MNTTSRPAPLRRSSRRIIGGVCGGLAERLGVSPVLVRAGAVVAAMVSSGLVVAAYLLAWVLIPPAGTDFAAADRRREESEPATRAAAPPAPPPALTPSPVDARDAWYAVGDQLQALVGEMRRPARAVGAVPDRAARPGGGGRPGGH